jgi:hypothetical protein
MLMRLVPAVVLGYFAVVTGNAPQTNTPPLAAGMTKPALTEMDQALGFGLAREAPKFDAALDTPRRFVTTNGRVVSLPNGCRTVSRPFDVLIHFHGAPTAMEPAFERSDIDGVLVILNLGNGSGRYEQAFQFAGSFDDTLDRVSTVLQDLCPGASAKPKRIALSGWSAGYGAISRIIDRPKDAARVDAVLLADGLHSNFEPGPSYERRVSVDQLAPFSHWADEAVAGRKLFALTHSSIGTTYASTTETADFLLAQESLERKAATAPAPRPGMAPIYRADSADFHVLGFAGVNEQAHCDHLHAFGDLLLPYLKERWLLPQ